MKPSELRANISTLTVMFLSIVLFVHHSAYTPALILLPDLISELLSTFAVGGFFFLSGYKLSLSKLNYSRSEFFLNRILRIHPLYIVAVILFANLIQPETSMSNLIAHLLGIQIVLPHFFGDNLLTLYFVGILYLYYLLFTVTKKYLSSFRKFLLINLVIFFSLFILHVIKPFSIQLFEHRFFRYYPYFISGMILATLGTSLFQERHIKRILSVLITFSCLNLLTVITGLVPQSLYGRLVYLILLVFPVFITCYLLLIRYLWSPKMFGKAVHLIAQASFAIYLFHRPIWKLLDLIWHQNSLWHQAYILLFGTLLIFMVSYGIQISYNDLIASISKFKVRRLAYAKSKL